MSRVAESEYFNVGMIVEVVTLHKKVLKGEVVAFDLATRMLAIKSSSASSKAVGGRSDVQVVNLQYVSDIQTISEAPADLSSQALPNLNFAKLTSRMNSNTDEKLRKIGYTGVGVSALAQRLVNAITKTLAEVRWDGQNVVVMDVVTISPPYGVADCRLNEGQGSQVQALHHVQKLVGKFHRENNSETATTTTTSMSPN